MKSPHAAPLPASATGPRSGAGFRLDTTAALEQGELDLMIAVEPGTEPAKRRIKPLPAPDPVEAAIARFPRMRYMGSKFRLLRWIYDETTRLEFETVLDGFSGSASVGYLFKATGKRVVSNDSLNFSQVLARALIENSDTRLTASDVERLRAPAASAPSFIRDTFSGIFFTPDDLSFLDRVWANLRSFRHPAKQALAVSALVRACAKRQPRGVFTVAGDPERYKDARRDLQLSLEEHFVEGTGVLNAAVFDNGKVHRAIRGDIFDVDPSGLDLVYLDPPYVPRADDNCYVKRYHFLEGVSCYWRDLEILPDSRVRKIRKPYTPFGYRRSAVPAFTRLFEHFSRSTLILSYSSNGYPDLGELIALMKRVKRKVTVSERAHRYHFGTHSGAARNAVTEYLIIGS